MTIKVIKDETIELTIIVKGDVNGDGEVDITDLVKIRQKIQKIDLFDEKQNKAGDINGDNEVDITDLVKIRRYIQKLETW